MSKKAVDRAFIYKCRLCGEMDRNPFMFCDTFKVIEILTDIAIRGHHRTPNSGAVNNTSIHICKNGGVGISDLQGMAVASTETEVTS